MKAFLAALSLCLVTAGGARAATEGVVQAAQPVQMEEVSIGPSVYLPDESYYADASMTGRTAPSWAEDDAYGQTQSTWKELYCRPELTPGEKRRLLRLMEQTGEGELTGGEAVIGLMESVSLGVYPLDPAEYDGEPVYVILPGTCMTDEQLIALMDAYDRLGLTLDPEGFSARNCMRGGGRQASRALALEEMERSATLTRLIQTGAAGEDDAAGLVCIGLNPESHLLAQLGNGETLTTFQLLPYRSLSDAELVMREMMYGTRDLSGEFDLNALEKLAYEGLTQQLGLPLSLEMTSIFSDRVKTGDSDRYLFMTFVYVDAQGEAREVYVHCNQRTLQMSALMPGDGQMEEIPIR